MNRLDNLPVDIIKIINRKVEDLHIQERRIERKRNRAENRLMKHKKEVKTKFIELVMRKKNFITLSKIYSIMYSGEMDYKMSLFLFKMGQKLIFHNVNE